MNLTEKINNYLNEKIEVDTTKYEFSHKVKPSTVKGIAGWAFSIGMEEFRFTSKTWKEAVSEAKQKAKTLKVNKITVLP